MSRVEINANGRSVVIDHTGDLPYLAEQALKLWEQIEAPENPGPAYGFQAERARTHQPVGGQYRRNLSLPVEASE